MPVLGAAGAGDIPLLRLDKAVHANLEPPPNLLPARAPGAAHRGAAAATAAGPATPKTTGAASRQAGAAHWDLAAGAAVPDTACATHRDLARPDAPARPAKAPLWPPRKAALA